MSDEPKLSDLKVGDLVVVQLSATSFIRAVARVTPTQFVIDNYRYRRTDGRYIGDHSGWYAPHLSLSPAAFSKAREQHVTTQMRGPFAFDQAGANKMREVARTAEALLREMGKWEE